MNKLKLFAAALLLFAVPFVGGCAGMDMHTKPAEANEKQILENVCRTTNSGMIIIDNSYILMDTRTGVNYLVNKEGGVCVMVDADGKPLVSEGE